VSAGNCTYRIVAAKGAAPGQPRAAVPTRTIAEGGCPHADNCRGGCPHADNCRGGCPYVFLSHVSQNRGDMGHPAPDCLYIRLPSFALLPQIVTCAGLRSESN